MAEIISQSLIKGNYNFSFYGSANLKMSIVFSEPFKESIENKKKAATTTTASHNNKDEKFPVDRSDFLALRSVEDDKELEEEKSSEENNVVGGVSNIPLFSSSEEKLLAYASEQVNTSVNFKKYLGSTQKLCSLGKGNTTCTIIYLTDCLTKTSKNL